MLLRQETHMSVYALNLLFKKRGKILRVRPGQQLYQERVTGSDFEKNTKTGIKGSLERCRKKVRLSFLPDSGG